MRPAQKQIVCCHQFFWIDSGAASCLMEYGGAGTVNTTAATGTKVGRE